MMMQNLHRQFKTNPTLYLGSIQWDLYNTDIIYFVWQGLEDKLKSIPLTKL